MEQSNKIKETEQPQETSKELRKEIWKQERRLKEVKKDINK